MILKKTALIPLFALLWLPAMGQGMFGVDAGLGRATAGRSHTTPTFTGYYFKKLSRTIYYGAALSYQRYSFLYNYNPASVSYGDVLSIRQKSSYLFLTPKVDIGLGYRKYVHLSASFGPGILAAGQQWTYKYESYLTTPPVTTAADTMAFYTAGNMRTLVTRYTVGVAGRIPTGRYWNVMVSGEYSHIPTNLNAHGPDLRTNYFCLTVGIMHKYPMAFLEY